MKKIIISVASIAILTVSTSSAFAWERLGKSKGVEVYFEQFGSSNDIKFKFKNHNSYDVSIDVDETIIWCGGTYEGQGDRQETDINKFTLKANESRMSPGWNHYQCKEDQIYIQMNNVVIRRK